MFCLYEGTRETASRLLRVGFRAAALGPEDAQDVLVAEPRGALVGLVVKGAPLPPQEEEGVEVSLGGRERGEEKPGLEVVLARAEGPLARTTRVNKKGWGWSARRDWSNGVEGGRTYLEPGKGKPRRARVPRQAPETLLLVGRDRRPLPPS